MVPIKAFAKYFCLFAISGTIRQLILTWIYWKRIAP